MLDIHYVKMANDDRSREDLERGGDEEDKGRAPTDSCPSDTDSCPSDTDSCPSDDSQDEEQGELPELKKFAPKPQPLQRRRSSIQKMIDLVLEKEDEVRNVTDHVTKHPRS